MHLESYDFFLFSRENKKIFLASFFSCVNHGERHGSYKCEHAQNWDEDDA